MPKEKGHSSPVESNKTATPNNKFQVESPEKSLRFELHFDFLYFSMFLTFLLFSIVNKRSLKLESTDYQIPFKKDDCVLLEHRYEAGWIDLRPP